MNGLRSACLLFFAALCPCALSAQDAVRGRVANPHGSLNLPCENCHTTTAWKPIRKQPEFHHNSQTNFALLGLHQTVACTGCHVNLNFSKAATRCSECHADLHRRQFGENCQECHTVRGWNVEISAIRDHNNRFPLLGAHAATTCDSCHRGAASGIYVGLSTQCVGCHLKDYQTATPLNHVAAGLPTTCESCHTMTVWQGARFNHNQVTSFALTGAHAAVACAQCHVGNRFAGTPTACFGCHASDFTSTQNPNHVTAGFPQDCSTCHTTLTWSGANFDHNKLTAFPLTGLHASVTCAQCHAGGKFVGTATACSGCHLQDYANTTNPNHRAGNFSTTCETCHNTTGWQNATFDHSTSGFPLTGAHTAVACALCHVNNNFTLSSGACVTCHLNDYNTANNPNHKAANFPQDCTGCHNTVQWAGAQFNHTSTGFALTGAHTSLQCAQCHVNGNYSFTNAACINCHLNDYNGAANPNHKAAGFPQDCTLCHTTVQWMGAQFNHTATGFALTGAHTSVQCAQCHVGNNYSLSSPACIGCHLNDFNGTNNPNHKAAGFPQDCSVCHTTVNWDGATFNHATTGFALVGLHATQQCLTCHVNSNYSLPNAACINCHLADFNGTTNPPHQSAGFPQDCTICHGSSITNWTSATFNHSTTGFALTGAHTSVQCAQCHANNNYSLPNGACWNCHQTDYNGTTNPAHKAANFPQDCSGCHTTTNWLGATFNHTTTGFALVGVHATQQCAACHINGNYTLTSASAACWNCHQTDYNGATNPPHASAGFPQDCTLCHGSTITNWTSATFNHATTGFTLTGAHTSLQCAQCHVNSNYSLTSAACWNCHQTDYNTTNNPPHKTQGFPQDCSGCHTTTNWLGATFNHATTGFILTGMHATIQCAQCHVNNNYSLTSAACWNCHQSDYNGTNSPSHAAAGFPQDCSMCHSTTNWLGATFSHPTSPLQLTGYHATMLTNNQCSLCHVGNNYTTTPSDCWSCHQSDYNNTTNPNHAAASFAQTCNSCHTFVDWTGAKYTAHDSAYFPIYSGTHNGKWTQCSDCHTNSSNYAVFTCIACHQHSNQAQVTNNHQGVKGFVYNGTSCYTCHPKGTTG